MELTPEQSQIINCNINYGQTLKVIAFAGTGKTSTLIEYTKARPWGKFLYVCFNKSTQIEAANKFPRNVFCKTAHSLAYREFGSKYRHKLVPYIKANMVMDIINVEEYEVSKFAIETLTSYLSSSDSYISKNHIPLTAIIHYKSSREQMPDLIPMAAKLWERMQDEFDDSVGMLHDGYLKLYQLSNPQLNFDFILLDESQDTNPVTADFLLKQRCAKILVGDPHQQIYKWRGAVNAMDKIPSAIELYLTHSFRFGNNIAKCANLLLHKYKNESKSLVGFKGDRDRICKVAGDNYAIISRTNAGLFNEAANLYKHKQIGFVGGVDSYRFDLITDTYFLYKEDKSKIRDPFIKLFDDYSEMKKYANIAEDWEVLSRCKVVDIYKGKTPWLVNDIKNSAVNIDEAEVVFSTTHKAKGLEFEAVRLTADFTDLIDDDFHLMNIKDIDPDEINIIYVAMTRSKRALELPEELKDALTLIEGKPLAKKTTPELIKVEKKQPPTLLEYVPTEHQHYKTLPKVLKMYSEKHGFEYVKQHIKYVSYQNPSAFMMALKKALRENSAEIFAEDDFF